MITVTVDTAKLTPPAGIESYQADALAHIHTLLEVLGQDDTINTDQAADLSEEMFGIYEGLSLVSGWLNHAAVNVAGYMLENQVVRPATDVIDKAGLAQETARIADAIRGAIIGAAATLAAGMAPRNKVFYADENDERRHVLITLPD